jgi:hypothetical protein
MTYIVQNPNHIDAGVIILSWRPPGKPEQAQDWYEGDVFVAPDGMDAVDVKDWQESGFIEEVE